MELLLQRLGQKLGSISLFGDQEQHEPIFEEFNLSAVAKYIQKSNCKFLIQPLFDILLDTKNYQQYCQEGVQWNQRLGVWAVKGITKIIEIL